jgi:hypothetical protein
VAGGDVGDVGDVGEAYIYMYIYIYIKYLMSVYIICLFLCFAC